MPTTCSGLTLQLHIDQGQQIAGQFAYLHHRGSVLCLDVLSRSEIESHQRGYHPQNGGTIERLDGLSVDGSRVTCFDLTPWRFWRHGNARKDRYICAFAVQGQEHWDVDQNVGMVEVGLSGLSEWGHGSLRQPRIEPNMKEDTFFGSFLGPEHAAFVRLDGGLTVDTGWSTSYSGSGSTSTVSVKHYFRLYGDSATIAPTTARTFASKANLLLMLLSGRASRIQFVRLRGDHFKRWTLWSSSLGKLHDSRRTRHAIGDIPLRELETVFPQIVAKWFADPNPLERPTVFYLSMDPQVAPFNEAAAMGVFSSIERLCREACEGVIAINNEHYDVARDAIKSTLKCHASPETLTRLMDALGGAKRLKLSEMVERTVSSLPEAVSKLFCRSSLDFAKLLAKVRNDIGHLNPTSREIAEIMQVVRKARCLLHILILQRLGVSCEVISRNLIPTYGDEHSP